ncbi:MFS transporter [Oligella ureolytica]
MHVNDGGNPVLDVFQILLLVVAAVLVVGQMYMPIPLLGQFNINYPNYSYSPSLLITSFGIAYAVGFLVFGPLSDYLGHKLVIVSGLILLAAASVAVAYGENTGLILARAVQGFVAASFPPVALSYIATHFSDRFKNWAISAIAISFLSAVTFGQLITIAFSDGTLYRQELLVSLAYLLLAVMLFFALTKTNHSNAKLKDTKTKLISPSLIVSFLFRKDLAYLYFITFSVLFVYIGHYIVVDDLLSDDFGNEGLHLRLMTLPFFLIGFLSPRLIKFGSERSLLYTYAAYLMLFILNFICYLLDYSYFNVFLLCVMSAMTALIIPNLIASISGRSHVEERGTALALYTFVLFVGASLSPIIFGFFVEKNSYLIEALFISGILSVNFFLLKSHIKEL